MRAFVVSVCCCAISAAYAVIWRLSVCPSVRLVSVTFVYYVKTINHILIFFTIG